MNPKTCVLRLARLFAVVACCLSLETQGQIVISEIMYHPVEEPAFNTDGSPVLDLYEDVHEFVEIHNPGPNTVDLTAWKITGGIRTPSAGHRLAPGGYRVVAKIRHGWQRCRHGLALAELLGHTNQLGNAKIRSASGAAATGGNHGYSPSSRAIAPMPWGEQFHRHQSAELPISRRSLGVWFTHSGNDRPTGWPRCREIQVGKTECHQPPIPRPVGRFSVRQDSNIRNNQPVRIVAPFRASSLSGRRQWFVEDINDQRATDDQFDVWRFPNASSRSFWPVKRSVVDFVSGDRGAGTKWFPARG